MNKTGNKINYSVRPKKNIERKLFCEAIRSMCYFGRLDQYRYVGFGSYFFQDFMLFHKEFSIDDCVSLEIDNKAYAKNSDIVHGLKKTILEKWDEVEKEFEITSFLIKKIISEMNTYAFNEMRKVNSELIEECSHIITEILINQIRNCGDAVYIFSMQRNNEYDYSFSRIVDLIYHDVFLTIINTLGNKLKREDTSLKAEIDDAKITEYKEMIRTSFDKKVQQIVGMIDTNIIKRKIQENCINRYLFNRPYGFIDIKFAEAMTALDKIDWNNDDKKNIIWLDYDEFLKPSMLDCFEKCISKAAIGSLLIISASMENDADIRYSKFINDFEDSHRISVPIKKGQCDNSEIGKTFYKIISDAANAAISNRNAIKQELEPNYCIQQILNCTYNDGTPMFTYALFIYSEKENVNEKDFPTNLLKQHECFSFDEKIYEITMPVLTNKEITLINQYLPYNDVEKIIELIPFIPSKEIKRYAKIYKYYPNFVDVGYYI